MIMDVKTWQNNMNVDYFMHQRQINQFKNYNLQIIYLHTHLCQKPLLTVRKTTLGGKKISSFS